jgi:hypothetical protein
MNPSYILRINVTLALHKSHRDKQMTFSHYIDFVPVEGMKIKFTNEEDEELEIMLINLHYDFKAREWVEDQQDDTLLEELREPDRSECTVLPGRAEEYINFYKSFGWTLK